MTKECSQNHGNAGDFCTITGSNLNAIDPGMKVIYTDAAGPFGLGDFGFDTDLVLDGPGNNDAYGHVVLSFLTGTGTVTFSGGTGRFSGFHAGAAVTYSDDPCALGRNVQLHPTRPRQMSGCATRSDEVAPASIVVGSDRQQVEGTLWLRARGEARSCPARRSNCSPDGPAGFGLDSSVH